jgi:hypothetical protein
MDKWKIKEGIEMNLLGWARKEEYLLLQHFHRQN